MAFELKHAVIHSFDKDRTTVEVPKEKIVKKPLFNTKLPTVISLVNGIHTVLGKVGNNVVWGQFSGDGRQGKFPDQVSGFVKDQTPDFFKSLTEVALDELVNQAKDKPLATGGHTLFAYYINDAIPFLLVANIKQRSGLRLGEDYVPVESVDIDMSKIQQAARINLSRYSEYILDLEKKDQNQDVELIDEADKPEERSYLCFVSRGRDSEASEYFVNALGCKKGVASRRATNNAIDVIADFFRGEPELRPFALEAQERVTRYLKGKLDTKQKANLVGIFEAAKGAVPPEKAELIELTEKLVDVLNNEENQVPEEFTVNKAVLERKTKIKVKAPRWELNFEKGALGETANSEIWYDSSNKKLVITQISKELLDIIDSELSSRPKQA